MKTSNISETVKYLKDHGREVVYDAEHFFDGYNASPGFRLANTGSCEKRRRGYLCLCDTNGAT